MSFWTLSIRATRCTVREALQVQRWQQVVKLDRRGRATRHRTRVSDGNYEHLLETFQARAIERSAPPVVSEEVASEENRAVPSRVAPGRHGDNGLAMCLFLDTAI